MALAYADALKQTTIMPISYEKYLAYAKRLNGVAIWGFTWNPPQPLRDRVRRVVTFCEDRRVLFVPHSWELPQECVESVVEIRALLTSELGEIERGSELADRLSEMRKACRSFLDTTSKVNAERSARDWRLGRREFDNALDELRVTFGQHIFWLMMAYGLTVEDHLARIFPANLTGEIS